MPLGHTLNTLCNSC